MSEINHAKRLDSFVLSRLYIAIAMMVVLSGCGKASLNITHPGSIGGSLLDFAKSEIITNGDGIADGTSELLIAILLMNSDGTVIPDYRPSVEVVAGSGVEVGACTTSNKNGVSTCILKATQPGSKRISVANIKIKLEKELVFNAPNRKGTIMGLASAAKHKVNASGYTISAAVGNPAAGIVKTSTSGWKVYGGVEGGANVK